MGQDLVDGRVARAFPHRGPAAVVIVTCRKLQIVVENPKQRLANASQFSEFAKDHCQSILHAEIRILFRPAEVGREKSDWGHHDQLTPHCFFLPRLPRPLTKHIQFIFTEAALVTCDIKHELYLTEGNSSQFANNIAPRQAAIMLAFTTFSGGRMSHGSYFNCPRGAGQRFRHHGRICHGNAFLQQRNGSKFTLWR